LCPLIEEEGGSGGAARVADDTAGASSHAGHDHHMPQGGTEADRGVTRDQGDGATRELTEGHPDSAKGKV
jgi:hypothetical protein